MYNYTQIDWVFVYGVYGICGRYINIYLIKRKCKTCLGQHFEYIVFIHNCGKG